MIEAPRKFQAAFFTDTDNLRPSVDTITPLLQAFTDRSLLPTTYTELVITGSASGVSPKAFPRLRLASSDGEWMIDFERVRINIEKHSIKPSGENLGSPQLFIHDAIDFFRRILTIFPKRGSRLALVMSESLFEIPEEQLNAVYPRLMTLLEFFRENQPLTWSSRSHTRVTRGIAGHDELLNVILKVDRVQADPVDDNKIIPSNRLDVETDINTYQLNREQRFVVESAEAFFLEAITIREHLISSLRGQMNV